MLRAQPGRRDVGGWATHAGGQLGLHVTIVKKGDRPCAQENYKRMQRMEMVNGICSKQLGHWAPYIMDTTPVCLRNED